MRSRKIDPVDQFYSRLATPSFGSDSLYTPPPLRGNKFIWATQVRGTCREAHSCFGQTNSYKNELV